MRQPSIYIALLLALAATWRQAAAQSGLQPIAPSTLSQGTNLPSTGNPPMVPINPATQSGTYASPLPGASFDPYASSSVLPPATGYAPPAYTPPPYVPPPYVPPAGTTPYAQAVAPAATGALPGNNPPYGSGPVVPPAAPGNYPPTAYPPVQPYGSYPGGAPASLYPGSTVGSYPPPPAYGPGYGANPYAYAPAGSSWNPEGSMFAGTTSYQEVIQFCQGGRFRYAYIAGNNDADALQIQDFDAAVAFTWPSFFLCNQPLYIMPSFSLHLWDGPKPNSSADLPGSAYSAFLDLGYQSDPRLIWGAELGFRVGAFTDFDTWSSDSLRFGGRAIARMRTTPNCVLKVGVLYLDRLRLKLLPAGGILWMPNPDTRFDIFFPEPKLSHRLTTFGTTDSWWYLGGYYGGGSWTVTRANGSEDRIDINDIRVVLGMEWGRNDQLREGRRVGFAEIGYVFERELLYQASPLDNMSPQDTLMFRVGIGY